jgi:hypothetical protein
MLSSDFLKLSYLILRPYVRDIGFRAHQTLWGPKTFSPLTLCLLHGPEFPRSLPCPLLRDFAECSLKSQKEVKVPCHLPRPRRVQSTVKASRKVLCLVDGLMVCESTVPGPLPL